MRLLIKRNICMYAYIKRYMGEREREKVVEIRLTGNTNLDLVSIHRQVLKMCSGDTYHVSKLENSWVWSWAFYVRHYYHALGNILCKVTTRWPFKNRFGSFRHGRITLPSVITRFVKIIDVLVTTSCYPLNELQCEIWVWSKRSKRYFRRIKFILHGEFRTLITFTTTILILLLLYSKGFVSIYKEFVYDIWTNTGSGQTLHRYTPNASKVNKCEDVWWISRSLHMIVKYVN